MTKEKIYKNRKNIQGFYIGLLPFNVVAVGTLNRWTEMLHQTQNLDYFYEIENLRCSEQTYVLDFTYEDFIEQRLKNDLEEASENEDLNLPVITRNHFSDI